MTNPPLKRQPGEAPLLKLVNVSKQYPGVLALDGMNFDLRKGEIHVLLGENGAGKSTMISIISGAIQPSAGEIILNGYGASFASVQEARAAGITTVFQEFSLVPSMTVEENLFLGSEPCRGGIIDRAGIRKSVRSLLDRLGFGLDPGAVVNTLTRAEQQMVEIARAFRSDLSVLVLDEPTASLTDKEADRLFDLVEQVRAQGVGVIYITHRMREIERLADRITLLRDGRFVATVDAKVVTQPELLQLMTGRVIGDIFPDLHFEPGGKRFEVRNLTTVSGSVRGASIEVRGGEIVGLAGLVGSGKSEIIRAVFGLEKIVSGEVLLDGRDMTGKKPGAMLRAGLSYMPPDRRNEGLAMMRACSENITYAALDTPEFSRGMVLNRANETREVRRLAEAFELHPMRPDRAVEAFSGGNQQKVLLARSVTRPISVYVFDEPTVGVDVGTRAAIYRFIAGLCDKGAAVIIISSDLPEVLNLSNRAYVFYDGIVQAEIARDDLSEARVLPFFFGHKAA